MKFNAIFRSSCRYAAVFTLATLVAACGRGRKNAGDYPDWFDGMTSAGKVEYVMKHAEPDSVARFICMGALGKIPGVKLDLPEATLYAYEHYKDKEFEQFTIAYEDLSESLPLADKMRLYKLAGTADPQQFGYTLGLEYISSIRNRSMDVAAVRSELEEFRKACGSDADTFRRFVIGFKTALKADHGKDLDEAIYNEFINYEENI